jgi:hypothetical protein
MHSVEAAVVVSVTSSALLPPLAAPKTAAAFKEEASKPTQDINPSRTRTATLIVRTGIAGMARSTAAIIEDIEAALPFPPCGSGTYGNHTDRIAKPISPH